MKLGKYILFGIIPIFLCSQCATFQGDFINSNPLNKTNLTHLNGKYKIVCADSKMLYTDQEPNLPYDSYLNQNFFEEIDRKLMKDTLMLDSLNKYEFILNIVEHNRLKVSYLKDNTTFRERIIKTKLKKDGYLYLKNQNTKFIMIPYLFGAVDIKKVRLIKTKDNNLIFDVSNHRSGAVLFIGFLSLNTYCYRNVYPKVE
jgi:hypothetical protein